MGCQLILLLGFLAVASAAEWGYVEVDKKYQPENWKNLAGYSECGGSRQSPIHLYSDSLQYDESLGEFTFNGYDRAAATDITVVNNGHTLSFSNTGENIYIHGGGLPGTYDLVGFHLHWGSDNDKGSEHWIDSVHYAAELHLVHKKRDYPTLGEAVSKGDGLAVLGIMIKVGDENKNFQSIVDAIPNVLYSDDAPYNLKNFPMMSLLPQEKCFERYLGSLTTPPCNEAVVWTVFTDAIEMSEAQMATFRTLHHAGRNESNSGGDYKLVDNHRPPQDLAGRTVHTSCRVHGGDDDDDVNAATAITTAFCLMFASVLAALLAY